MCRVCASKPCDVTVTSKNGIKTRVSLFVVVKYGKRSHTFFIFHKKKAQNIIAFLGVNKHRKKTALFGQKECRNDKTTIEDRVFHFMILVCHTLR